VDRVADGGGLIVVEQSSRPARLSTFTLVQRRLTLRGRLIYDHPGDFARTLALLRDHDLRPGRVLRARFEFADAPAAFAQASDVPGKSWISLPRTEDS
jgi:alcohol dehydrogenase/L-iditol 2-dehydrogenase